MQTSNGAKRPRLALAAGLLLPLHLCTFAPPHALAADPPATTPTPTPSPIPGPTPGSAKPDREPTAPAPAPDAPDAVTRLLAAPYLTPDQARDKRIFFGRASALDLDSPARAARSALARAIYDDPSLASPEADPLDRAEAALARGEPDAALALLPAAPDAPPRAARLRVRVLELRGDYPAAVRAAEAALAAPRPSPTPADVVDTVRLREALTRLRGPGAPGSTTAADYQAMMQTLGELRSADRLFWPAALAEAELLYARDNKPEAAQALSRVLELNPECAAAWHLLGRLMVDSFAFPRAEAIARRLDLLDSSLYDPDHPDAVPDGPAESASPLGAMIVARTLLRQSEGAQALAVMAPAAARYPAMPDLAALRCAAEAVRFDFPAARAALAAFDARFGPSAMAHAEVGAALSGARQYARAREHLEEALKRQPSDPDAHAELGLMLLQAGDDAAALAALERAFALDPFNARADNSLRLARELQTYEKVESEHYIVRFKPGPAGDGAAPGPGDALLAREMLAPLEINHALVAGPAEADPAAGRPAGGIDFTPPQKTVIDLMPDHRWFGVRIAGMPAIHTIAASTGPVIAMESPRDGPNHLGTYDWVRVLRHEYVHTVTLARTNNRIPHWFTEASAVYLEHAPRDYPTCTLLARALDTGALFDFNQINIAFVRPEKPTDRQQAYAQGHWMYEYIVERFGPRAPLGLMDKYAAGVREEEAYQAVLGLSRARFFDDFKAWARTQVIAWGLELPEGVPSVRMLQARAELTDPDVKPERRPALELLAASRDPKAPEPKEGEKAIDLELELPEPTPAQAALWLAEHPTHPDLLQLAVTHALEAAGGKATPETAPLIERYAAARPVDPTPHRLLARMYLDAGRSDDGALAAQAEGAIPHLEFLDQRETKINTYALELARRYAATGQLPRAAAKAERATQIAPFEARPRELAATYALQSGDLAAAERHIAALTEIEPTQTIHQRRLDAVRKRRGDSAR